jgi:hypothetical protein
MITFPFVMVGILFVLSHFLKKKNRILQHSKNNSYTLDY